jgi:type IV pilus assembly protein PilW
MNTRIHRRAVRGFTLIELMVALVLGLVISGAALAVFVTNRQTYAATESLGRIQENARTGFELMARDLRQAAGNDCGNDVTSSNVLNNPADNWYTDWTAGITGYDGGTDMPDEPANRVNGTDAIDIRSANSNSVTIVPDSGNNPAEIQLTDNSGLAAGDIVVACDPGHMSIFQLTNIGGSGKVVHNTGTGSPGNCTKGLGEYGSTGIPATCTTNGNAYKFGCYLGQTVSGGSCDGGNWPATLAKMTAGRWYIGTNDHGTRSLYHAVLTNSAGAAATRADEIAEGVQDLQLTYLLKGAISYVDADAIPAADWAGDGITAVRMVMTVNDNDRSGTDRAQISRVLEHTITFRNRAP